VSNNDQRKSDLIFFLQYFWAPAEKDLGECIKNRRSFSSAFFTIHEWNACHHSTLHKRHIAQSVIKTFWSMQGMASFHWYYTWLSGLLLFGAEDNERNRSVSPSNLNLKQGLWHYNNRNCKLSFKKRKTKSFMLSFPLCLIICITIYSYKVISLTQLSLQTSCVRLVTLYNYIL
jgi:hypothetical protein